MAIYKFSTDNIPSGIGSFDVIPDKGFTRGVKHKVLTAKFGDGYQQRSLLGINTRQETYKLQLKNRTDTEIDKIAAFLDSKAGLSFPFLVTEFGHTSGDTSCKVTCENYNISYTVPGFSSMNLTFKRVFEP